MSVPGLFAGEKPPPSVKPGESPVGLTDREALRRLARARDPESLRLFLERYGDLVYASALRRTGRVADAAFVTRAVFFVLLRHARRLSRKTVVASWLFRLTRVACRKLPGGSGSPWWAGRWFRRNPSPVESADADRTMRLGALLDEAIDRLPKSQHSVVILRVLLDRPAEDVRKIVGGSEARVARRVAGGLRKMSRRFSRRGVAVPREELAEACAVVVRGVARPADPADEFMAEELVAAERQRPRPSPFWHLLARRIMGALALARWRRRILVGSPSAFVLLIVALGILWHLDSRTGHSRLLSLFLIWSVKNEARTVPGLAQPAREWPPAGQGPRWRADEVRGVAELYRTTNIWLAHLIFSRDAWQALQPKSVPPLPHFLQPDGTALLRNPKAQRSGLAGVLGFDFNWVHADLEFGGRHFTNVGARLKGNGTYLGSLVGHKTPFKVDLNRFVRGQKIAGADELNFHNLTVDHSFMSDALGYEFFRNAGVPAPRTAYAYLSVTVEGQWSHKPLGLYAMVEPVDADFAEEHLGSRRAPVFKPVTYDLFQYLGDDWEAYREIYDLKTEATEAQRQRVIDFARLVTSADDVEFARRLGEFLDLERFADFLAGQVLLSNYDGLFSTGQNYYLYLHPASGRFGFIPWDLDLAWGGFFLIGSTSQRERASIWHPWAGRNRFLERVLAAPEFRVIYRRQLEDLLTRLFRPAHWQRRVDEMAGLLRAPVAAESDFRRRKFEDAISDRNINRSRRPEPNETGANRPAHQIKLFLTHRAESVRRQLDGKSEGVILKHRGQE
jgi:DNA-directed RNA polymerase specialized sigma24 family protein